MEPGLPVTAFVGLGSNLGPGPTRLQSAIVDMDRLPRTRVSRRSSWYRSLPMGGVSQPVFTNAVVEILTRLSPQSLLAELHKIERRNGRVRNLRWGPRTLDLDLLVYGGVTLKHEDLTIPHPGIPVRTFVLFPLLEIAPHLCIPDMGTPICLVKHCPGPAPERL
jgi:2-amino-4-hydroxy-6-hydroxymethyldihydropteridine diphosphokinase